MKKDAYYFSHDSNAKDDPKCMLLIDQLGLEGYGIFWVLVEILRDQTDYRYPIELIPVIARRYGTSKEKMMSVVSNYNLFKVEEGKFFFSESLDSRMELADYHRIKGIRGSLFQWGHYTKEELNNMTDLEVLNARKAIKNNKSIAP